MKYEQILCAENPAEMALPLFQPLRLWSSRRAGERSCEKAPLRARSVDQESARVVSIRGGYMNVSGGERRLVIAGKIFNRG